MLPRLRYGLAACVAAFALCLGSAVPASAATCADFPNQAAAQAAANTIDADGDGIYCESLPCPCAKGGSAPAPAPTPSPAPAPPPTPTPTPMPTPVAADADADGVADGLDRCPGLPGPAPMGCPPDADGDGVFDTQDRCPTRAARGARGCPQDASNTVVACRGRSAALLPRVKPASCNTRPGNSASVDAADLRRLRWAGWGTPRATASGTDRRLGPVRVTLSQPSVNDCGGYSYTRLKITSARGALRQAIPASCGNG